MPLLIFYFINFSAFHQNGNVVWLGQDGAAVVQRSDRDTTQIYRFKIPSAEFADIRAVQTLKVNEREAIPDEVTVRFGVRQTGGAWVHLRVLDGDWSRQSQAIQRFSKLAQKIVALSAKAKPVKTLHVKLGRLKVERPEGFSNQDIDEAFASRQ